MDELSADDMRGFATAANLRRAFGPPDAAPTPQPFLALLRRLKERDGWPTACLSGASRPEA